MYVGAVPGNACSAASLPAPDAARRLGSDWISSGAITDLEQQRHGRSRATRGQIRTADPAGRGQGRGKADLERLAGGSGATG